MSPEYRNTPEYRPGIPGIQYNVPGIQLEYKWQKIGISLTLIQLADNLEKSWFFYK
jgi:hypothetical protein